MSKEALLHFCNAQRVTGRKVVFTNGCFDILHRGHIDILSKAADEGDILVVGINTDVSVKRLKGADRPINTELDRALQVAALLPVAAVCLFEEDTPLTLIQSILPDVLVKGGDYTKATVVGALEVEQAGGRVVLTPFVEGYATTKLLERIQSL